MNNPAKDARQMVTLMTVCARMNRQNPVKVLNDARTELLAEGIFDEYRKCAIAEADRKIAELIKEPVWQWR